MKFILIIGIFEALFLSLLILLKKNKNKPDYILASYFILFGVNILLSFIEHYNREMAYPYPGFINTTAPFLLLHGPVIWLYTMSQTSQQFRLKTVYLVHLIPFLIMIIDHTFNYYLVPVDERIKIATSEEFKNYPSYTFFVLLIAISPVAYQLWSIELINRYNKRIENYFSNTDLYDFNWLKKLLITVIIASCINNLVFIVDIIYPFASFKMMQFFAFIIASVTVLILGLFGHKQNNLFSTKPIQYNMNRSVKQKFNPDQLENEEKEFILSLNEYMLKEKPYLNPDITLSRLSSELDVSVDFLSSIINKRLNKNFFDFINYYRVEEFKDLIKKEENQKLTLVGIAYECGFNSKATFYRVFKSCTNLTPSQYKKSLSLS